MNSRAIAAAVGTAAGTFLIALATSSVASADREDVPSPADPDFISHTDNFGLFTDTAAADPDDSEYVANVIQGPSIHGTPLFTDVLTSGQDPSDALASVPGVVVPDDTGVGAVGDTVNTFVVPDLGIDSTFTLPFTDPLAEIFTALVPLGF
ncbi:hypothetical protein [Mycobacterium talmoniae]|uniref:Secreted protein n=1 Tax=Mycobacterium talmoniae TaxID=1858794 RepID=A0A1S1NG05_9MYCO|nr:MULTISPECIES: hypothetical protein [Mycobacterium]OHU99964.1 hypothetical protein BKN37_18685 [Mycobacterium talmoniae]PQM46570.1 hypothetical protein C1Y40_03251 [Mycobacterium talmoniae]TDH49463.1 hypothetical protein E2F47_20475 [Mycobacterium eburneum]